MAVKNFIYSWVSHDLLKTCDKVSEEDLTPEMNRRAFGVEHTPDGRFYLIPPVRA